LHQAADVLETPLGGGLVEHSFQVAGREDALADAVRACRCLSGGLDLVIGLTHFYGSGLGTTIFSHPTGRGK